MFSREMKAGDAFYDGFTIVTSIPDQEIYPELHSLIDTGAELYAHSQKSRIKIIKLADKFSSDGKEADIYYSDAKLPDGTPLLAKVYKKINERQKAKILLMLSKDVDIPGICYPVSWLSAQPEEDSPCIGILIPQAPENAKPLGGYIADISLSAKERLDIAVALLRGFAAISRKKLQIADFNMNNFLVSADRKIYFIDTDSWQAENFPCPVASPDIIFDHPFRIEQGFCNYSSDLRKPQEFAYGLCVMLFKTLINSEPYNTRREIPYEDCSDPTDILAGKPIFRNDKWSSDYSGEMWAACPEQLRKLFFNVFDSSGFFFYKKKELFMEDIIRFFPPIN
ncbi:MAG: hypothetical protein K5838_03035 [Elusimicrobiales bacterium]|nr:hypothetical protein [Elusimicrobiales bacterium]